MISIIVVEVYIIAVRSGQTQSFVREYKMENKDFYSFRKLFTCLLIAHDSIYTILKQKIVSGISHSLMKLKERQRCIIIEDPIKREQTSSEICQHMRKMISIRTNFIKMKYRRNNEGRYMQLIKEIAHSSPFVSVLVLQGSRMSVKAIRMIVEADWKFVTLLNLAKTGISDNGILLLSQGNWKFIRKLNLSSNPITNKGAIILAKCNLTCLSVLQMEKTNVTFQCLKPISKAMWHQLRILSLQGSNLGAMNLSIISTIGLEQLQCINLKSISTANIFLNCSDLVKITTFNPKLKIEVLTTHTICNSLATVQDIKKILPNLSSFGMIWRVPPEKGYNEQKIEVELSQSFSDDGFD